MQLSCLGNCYLQQHTDPLSGLEGKKHEEQQWPQASSAQSRGGCILDLDLGAKGWTRMSLWFPRNLGYSVIL